MTAQELKRKLTEDDIKKLLELMGATFYYEDDDMWITETICHHGTKPKLSFYKDSMSFHCYTECGQLDIIGVVMGYKGYEQEEFQKAMRQLMRQGVYYCILRETEDKYTLQELPSKFCNITGRFSSGLLFDFDMNWFIGNYGVDINMYPKIFKKMWFFAILRKS